MTTQNTSGPFAFTAFPCYFSNMQSYIKQLPLGTYLVSTSLLKRVESYLLNDVPEILDWPNSDTSEVMISISIFDYFGEEKLRSIDQYKHSQFRDDTNGITVQYELKLHDKEIKITLRFGTEAKSSDISIHLTDQKAREKVSAIEEGIFDVLDQTKTINWFFHPIEYVAGAIILTATICGILAWDSNYAITTKFYLGMVFWLTIIYFIIYQFLKRYSTFDTNKQKHLNVIYNWLVGGMASFLVFSCFATSIRKSIFGF
jgi:hypothetical protein